MSLSIQNLTANIGDQQILKGVNLEVPAGEVQCHHGQERLRQEHPREGDAGHPD